MTCLPMNDGIPGAAPIGGPAETDWGRKMIAENERLHTYAEDAKQAAAGGHFALSQNFPDQVNGDCGFDVTGALCCEACENCGCIKAKAAALLAVALERNELGGEPPVCPSGWHCVPDEPTPFMLAAMNLCERCHESARESYRAALEAGPDYPEPSELFQAAMEDAGRWYFVQHHLTDCGVDAHGALLSYEVNGQRRDVFGHTMKEAIDAAMAEAEGLDTSTQETHRKGLGPLERDQVIEVALATAAYFGHRPPNEMELEEIIATHRSLFGEVERPGAP